MPRKSRSKQSPKMSRRMSRRIRGGSSKCKPDEVDPISQEEFRDIPKERHIRIKTMINGRALYQCYDVRELVKQIKSTNKPMNPILRDVPFTEEQLRKIRRKERKLEDYEDENRYKENKSVFDETFRPRKGTILRF